MGRPKLSDWQDGNTKPTEIGVYQRRHYGQLFWSYWHGEFWSILTPSRAQAHRDATRPFRGQYQDVQWRGKL